MKLEITEDWGFLLKEVYNGISLESNNGEKFSICMKDTGFEFRYCGEWYEAKKGKITKLSKNPRKGKNAQNYF